MPNQGHLQGLEVGYASHRVAGPFDLQLLPGELICLIGPNGSGKSTLMKTLMGVLQPLAGQWKIQGESLLDMPPHRRAQWLALVTSHSEIVPGMTGFDSVALGRTPHTLWHGMLSSQDRQIVQQALKDVDASHLAQRPMAQMSDGERQRIAVARALAQQTPFVLLDEPLAFLDLPHRVALMVQLKAFCKARGMTVVLSIHDLDLALRFADKFLLLDQDGKAHYGIPEMIALDGMLGRVFGSTQIGFDLEYGEFHVRDMECTPVSIQGEGLQTQWLQRALRRLGYRIESGQYPLVGYDAQQTQPYFLQIAELGERQYFHQMDQLLVALNRREEL